MSTVSPEQRYQDYLGDQYFEFCLRRMARAGREARRPVLARVAPYTCPKCGGRRWVENGPTAECPDYEVTCPTCGGSGVVEDDAETEVPFVSEGETSCQS
jgi:DnaJ-class molecular chaperone